MKSETALYHCPGYAPRTYACEAGETPGTLNLLDDAGEISVSGVPVYEDPETIEELPADDPATAAQTDLDAETVASIAERLDAMDRGHAWTRDALHAIEDYEDATVGELAQQLERDVRRLKTDVRRLKALALTDRTDFGYRITARGSAFLAAEEGRSE